MRLRPSSLALLSLLPHVAGCLGHSENLRRGDEALAKNDHTRAMDHYEAVLADRSAEESDKDDAEAGYLRAWRARAAEQRGAEDRELAALEASTGSPLSVLADLRKLAARIRSHEGTDADYERAKALAARHAPAAWESVDRSAAANDYLGAEATALAIASTPGVPVAYGARLAKVREQGAAHHAERAAKASAFPVAAAYHRALAAHFARGPLPQAGEFNAASYVRYVVNVEASDACASTAAALRASLKDTKDGRGLPVTLDVRLARCEASDQRREEKRTSTYVEHRQVGTRVEKRTVTANECRDVWKDVYRDVAVGSSTTYTRSVGPGGVVHTTPQTNVRYEKQKSRELVKECGLVTREESRDVPVFQDFTHNVPYVHTIRTLAARIEGTASARTEGDAEVRAPIAASTSLPDEAYDREVAIDRHEVRALLPITSEGMLKTKQDDFAQELAALATKARLQRAERFVREAEALPAGPAREDLLARAALLGSPDAIRLLPLADIRLSSLFAGSDVIGSPDPAPEPPRTTAAAPELPKRSRGFAGYTSSLYMEALLGTVETGDIPRGAASPATAPATFRESATTVGMRMSFPIFGGSLERPRGFTFFDEGALGASLVAAASTGVEAFAVSPINLQAWAGYTAMLGVRLSSLGLFAGARAQSELMTTGHVESSGAQSVPLCGRLEYRVRGYFMPRATVCMRSLVGVERTSGELIVPFTDNADTAQLVGRYEELESGITLGELSMNGVRADRGSMRSMNVGVAWTF